MKFKPKKKLGQNFLVDEKLNNFISKLGNINRKDTVLEIGPGKGNLTKFLINENPKKLILIEKDNYLANELKIKFKGIDVINEDYLDEFYNYCKSLNLNIIGLMCIPPFNEDSSKYFKRMKYLKNKMGLKEISMGMSSDYLDAIENGSTFIRIGSDIFGQRNQ